MLFCFFQKATPHGAKKPRKLGIFVILFLHTY